MQASILTMFEEQADFGNGSTVLSLWQEAEKFGKFWKTLENFGKGSAVLPLWQEAENVQSQKAAVSEYRLPSADLYF